MTVERIQRARLPHPFEAYRFEIRPLSRAEGGGFLISFPDLPGCISDGDTLAEAVRNGKEAVQSWVSARIQDGMPIPEPSRLDDRAVDEFSSRFVQRIPRSLHAELAAKAEAEGVSLNSLVLALIANGLGRLRGGGGGPEASILAEPSPAYRSGKRTRSPGALGRKRS